jgi:hypothetical protein
MSVYVSNLVIDKGSDFSQNFTLSDTGGDLQNLVGYSGTSHLRKTPTSSNYSQFILTFIDREQGIVNLSMPSNITSSLKSGRHVYDILLIRPNNTRSIVLEGMVTVKPGISTNCF